MRERVALPVLAALLALTPVLSACEPERAQPPRKIILITIDTLRSDHVSCYGYARSTTPEIDRIAARGTIFEQAYAASSWTMPSMASIVTGVHPRTHGVRHGVFHPESMRISEQEALDPRFETLATLLKRSGYETFGITSNSHLAAEVGFDRGFDAFATLPFKGAFRVDLTLGLWMDRIGRAERYFLWVHYFDPHAPYASREPWIGAYDKDRSASEKWSRMVTDELAAVAAENSAAGFREDLIDLYDSEINFVDRSVGRLLEKLEPLDDAFVVITSDHGEEFFDHGGLGHKRSLHEELLRVPLVIMPPKAWAREKTVRRVETPVANLSVFQTVLAIAGVEPPLGVEGRSLLPLMTGTTAAHSAPGPVPIYSDLDAGGLSAESMRVGRFKLILESRPKARARLFDLETDPGETTDISASHADVVADLSGQLETWRRAHPLFEPERASRTISEPVMQQLRAMGYVE